MSKNVNNDVNKDPPIRGAELGWGDWVEPPKLKIMRHYNTLSWRQNAGNPTSLDLDSKKIQGEDASFSHLFGSTILNPQLHIK